SIFLRLDVRYSWQLFSPLMKQTLRYVFPLVALILILAHRSPAPIIYREGEGFLPGGAEDIEIKKNAQDQFDLAQRYEDRRDWAHAGASYRMVVRRFPRADIAPAALFNSGRMYEKQGKLEQAFRDYQSVVEKYPRSENFEPALEAEYTIAKAYLDGKKVDVYGVPTLPSMAKAEEMFKKIVTNGPFSKIAPLAQFGIGQSLEKSGSITSAVTAYQQVVDRYPNSEVAADAMYQIGYVYLQASRATGYDETAAVRAQEAFEDFLVKFPSSHKAAQAQDNLKTLQGRKSNDAFNIARFYDKQHNFKAAYVYYNEVLQQQPDSQQATRAKTRMDQIRTKMGDEALKIGTENPETGQTQAERRKLQAQVDTTSRPDYVGPPAPTPTPSPSPAASPATATAPENSNQKAPLVPPNDVKPAEPNLPSQ
ncbi:MAG TPA: outer membrane protein assembly factor BamD, partial [Chthoniobacterales bacterium]|nr:outer membrane protein assembly factor BamD [Chthoniobacterales bacterium]